MRLLHLGTFLGLALVFASCSSLNPGGSEKLSAHKEEQEKKSKKSTKHAAFQRFER